MKGINTIKPTFDKLCGYWPLLESVVTGMVYRVPKDWPSMNEDERRTFKFEQMALGAGSNMNGGVTVPVCNACPPAKHCRAVRIDNQEFSLTPSQKEKMRLFRRDVDVKITAPSYYHDMYTMFKDYVSRRHGNTNTAMTQFSTEDFKKLVFSGKWLMYTREKLPTFSEGRTQPPRLASFAIIDQHKKDFCLEYVVYDPVFQKRSPGLCTILSAAAMIKHIEPEGHLYIGDWSPNSPKTGYKKNFRGLEVYGPNGWEKLDRDMPANQLPPPSIMHLLK
jgi:arginyl-tRNA--protein-N-Asp/Glu arginylyltransferase